VEYKVAVMTTDTASYMDAAAANTEIRMLHTQFQLSGTQDLYDHHSFNGGHSSLVSLNNGQKIVFA